MATVLETPTHNHNPSSTGSNAARVMRATGPFRVGFVGTGFISDWHAKALKGVRNANLVAVCDRHEGRRSEFADNYQIKERYADWNTMFQEADLDAVHILLPPELHVPAVRDALNAGVNVLVEKPLAVASSDIAELIELANEKGLTLAVGHNFSFDPSYEQLRSDLQSGVLGRPDIITITWNRELPQILAGSSVGWLFHDPINILLEVGPHAVGHMIDLMGGKPDSLTARADKPREMENGQPCYRRWTIDADYGETLVRIVFSFIPGYTEHTVHVRGTLGSGVADLENWNYDRQLHTHYQDDFDRFWMTHGRAGQIAKQARRNIRNWAAAKIGMSPRGNQYAYSIQQAAQSFYDNIGTATDVRLDAQTGQAVIETIEDIGRAAGVERIKTDTKHGTAEATTVRHDVADVLVIGGTGFIGRETVKQFVAAGKKVRVLARDPKRFAGNPEWAQVDIRQGDTSDRESLRAAMSDVSTVVHLARAYGNTWDDFAIHDIPATRTIAELCLEVGVKRFVYSGTIDSYYAGKQGDELTEDVPLDPKIEWRKPYARAKAVSEDMLKEMRDKQGLPLVIVRPGIVIGTGGDPRHWGVGMFTHGTVAKLWGKGDNKLPLVLVQDVAAALVAIERTPNINGETFNLIGDPIMNAHEYIEELEQAAQFKLQVRPTPIYRYYFADMVKYAAKVAVRHPGRFMPSYRDWQGRTQLAWFNCQKAKDVLGWQPATSREELAEKGIRQPVREFLN